MHNPRILIVDDEPPARRKLISFLQKEITGAVLLEAGDGLGAVESIRQHRPDLVFLDIQMPGMNGFEVIEAIGPEQMPAVVFVTAYDRFAMEAFEVRALDYLLKPYDRARFKKSLDRALEHIELKAGNVSELKNLLAMLHGGEGYLQRILVSSGQRFFFVQTTEVSHFAAEEKYVRIHTARGSFLMRDTMSRLERRLDPAMFARVHRSFLVNLDFVREMQPWSHGDYRIILTSGVELPVSRRYRDRLFGRME